MAYFLLNEKTFRIWNNKHKSSKDPDLRPVYAWIFMREIILPRKRKDEREAHYEGSLSAIDFYLRKKGGRLFKFTSLV